MGAIYYGSSTTPITVDDRALAHLRVVITTKLRRGEGFVLSWHHGDGQAPGTSSIWLHPAIPVRFVFESPVSGELDAAWIQRLANAANTTGGLKIGEEYVDDDVNDASLTGETHPVPTSTR